MSGSNTGTAAPAAWYPDPQGSPLARWWDGNAWTQHTREPTPAVPEVPEIPAYIPMQGFGAAPAVDRTYSPAYRAVGSGLNVWVWLLAVMPVLQLVVALVVVLALKDLPGGVVRYALLIGPVAAHLYLAKRDGQALRDANLPSTPWGWILLPLVYFIIRTVRVGKNGLLPLFAWLACQLVLVLVALSVLVPVFLAWRETTETPVYDPDSAIPAAVPLTPEQRAEMLTPAGMGEKLLLDFHNGGVDDITYADCVPATSFEAGTEVLCATDLGGAPLTLVVTIQDDPYIPFYVTGTAP